MDKENNIDDILRLLKDKVENSETAEDNIEKSSDSFDAESLKEKLREQFASDEPIEVEEIKDEYALDESFAAEQESVVEQEPVVEQESVIEEELVAEHEPVVEQEPEIEIEPVIEVSIEKQSPEFEAFEISTEYIEMLESLAQREEDAIAEDSFASEETTEELQPVAEDIEGESVEAYLGEDDVPWYEDSIPLSESTVLDNNDGQDYSQPQYAEEGPFLEYYEKIDDTAHQEVLEDDEKIIQLPEIENAEEIVLSPEEINELNVEINSDEEVEESLYRTIMDAEHQTLARRAAQREIDEVMSQESFDDDELDGEYDFDGEEIAKIMHVSNDISDGDEGVGTVERSKYEEKYGISTDFYIAAEHDDAPEEAEEVDQQIVREMEFGDADEQSEQQIVKVSPWASIKPYVLGLLVGMLLLLELLPIFEIVPGGILDYTEYGIIYVLLDIQLTAFIVALYAKKLLNGLSRLMSLTVNVYSVLAITLAVTLAHSLLACFISVNGVPYLYNSISGVYILTAYIVDMLDAKRVRQTVSELILADEIYTMNRSSGKDSIADKMYLGGISPDTNIYEPAEVKLENHKKCFVNDRENTKDKTVIYAMTPVVIFSALVGVSSMVLGNEFSYVINAMAVSFTMLAPLSAIISSFLPIYVTYRRLLHRGCIIASAKAAQRIGDCDALVFSDRHLFAESNTADNGIKLYNEHRARDVLTCLDAVYEEIGGPMKRVFAGANTNGEKRKVNIVRITRHGIEAIVDGKFSVIIGSSGYLMRYGISTDAEDKKEAHGILYVALNSRLEAKLSLNYRTEPLFEKLCEIMGDNKISTVIRTYDPVISGAYVAYCRQSKEARYPVSVVHKNKADFYKKDKTLISSAKAGAFVLSSRLKLVELSIFAKKIVRLIKYNSLIRGALFGISAILSVIFTVGGAMAYVNTLWVLLYHILISAIFALTAIKTLPVAFDRMKTEEPKREKKEKTKK